MKIAVFGSTGKTGIEVIKQALEQGDEVVAYARNPKKITIKNKNLKIVQGELSDKEAIGQAIKGADAVISLLGASSSKVKDNSLSDGVKNIIHAMEKNGVERIIQVSTSAVPDPRDKFDLYFDSMALMVKVAISKVFKELQRISQYLKESSLKWTVVRVPFLVDEPLTKDLKIGYKGEKIVKKKLSRSNLAWFMLKQVRDKEYIDKFPFISNA